MRDRDRQILVKILKYCDEVIIANELYHSDKELFEDEKQGFVYKNSVCMSILQIGELSKNLSEEFARQYPGIPLKVMARMRDILAHHYGGINTNITFSTATKDVPEVKKQVSVILAECGTETE